MYLFKRNGKTLRKNHEILKREREKEGPGPPATPGGCGGVVGVQQKGEEEEGHHSRVNNKMSKIAKELPSPTHLVPFSTIRMQRLQQILSPFINHMGHGRIVSMCFSRCFKTAEFILLKPDTTWIKANIWTYSSPRGRKTNYFFSKFSVILWQEKGCNYASVYLGSRR